VAEHCGVSSLVIHPEDPKLKFDERNGLSPFEIGSNPAIKRWSARSSEASFVGLYQS
jgi:hypothetical protein